MNEVLKAITERFSCRDFKADMPSDEMLNLIADAAVKAPSGMNRQAWRVIVVKDKALMKDIEDESLAVLSMADDKSAYDRMMSRGGKIFYNAPAMIVVPVEKDSSPLDCGILCQNITLAATSLGLASLICGLAGCGFTTRGEEFSKKLGFPENYTLGCTVLLGYPNAVTPPHEPDGSKVSFV